jgi:RnfABCDGE-type electron transport complex D subunit
MKTPLLTVSTSPHLLARPSLRSRHIETLIALAPALAMGLYYFGVPGLTTVILTTVSALAGEYLAVRVGKLPNRIGDLHAVLMGVMLGLIMPAGAPWWVAVIGGLLTTVLGKMVFGGLGHYPMQPVLIAWAALSLSWPEHMNAFYEPLAEAGEWEVVETFLIQLKSDIAMFESVELPTLWEGLVAGAIGATCSWALIAGGIYLIIRRIINWRIPLGVLLGGVVMALVAAYTDERVAELGYEEFGQNLVIAWYHLGAGGMMIAAFFLATEPVSSPVTSWGTFLYGLGIGIMTVIVRTWGAPADGVYYAVLVLSAATPLFDRIRPRPLGKAA